MPLLVCAALVLLGIGMTCYATVRPVSAEYKAALALVITVAVIAAVVAVAGLNELARSE